MGQLLKSKAMLGTLLALLAGAYLSSYAALSLNGSYEPASVTLKGVQWWMWAPKGFCDEKGWSQGMTAFYFPLHFLDVKIWHKGSDYPFALKHPVNTRSHWPKEPILEGGKP